MLAIYVSWAENINILYKSKLGFLGIIPAISKTSSSTLTINLEAYSFLE